MRRAIKAAKNPDSDPDPYDYCRDAPRWIGIEHGTAVSCAADWFVNSTDWDPLQ